MPDQSDPKQPDSANAIKFHYIKGNGFRVIHVDGAIGGPTPQGLIHLAIFSERFPIPLQATHELAADGKHVATEPFAVVAREGIVREVEADLMLSVTNAEKLVEFLQRAIERTRKLSGSEEHP